MKIALRLAKWRNSEEKDMKVWQSIFSTGRKLSDDFFNLCIQMLSSYATANARLRYEALSLGTLGRIVTEIIKRASRGRISSAALTALIRSFEVSIFLKDDTLLSSRRVDTCLQKPLFYGRRLHRSSRGDRVIHRHLILLLAKDVQNLPDSEQLRRLQDLFGMIWITPWPDEFIQPTYWEELEEKHGQICQLEDLTEEIARDWILHVDYSTEITEAIAILIQLSPGGSRLGLRALYHCSKDGGKHMLALLRQFDSLISSNEGHSTLPITALASLCNVLQMNESGVYRPSGVDFSISQFATPFLFPIVYRALGMERIDEEMPDQGLAWSDLMDETTRYMLWNMSIRDPRPVWQSRAWLIFDSSGHNFTDQVTRLLEDAFRYPITLVRVSFPSFNLVHTLLAIS